MNRSYEPRTYRHRLSGRGLVAFQVRVAETDLLIKAETDLSEEAVGAVKTVRREIERYVHSDSAFLTTFEPYDVREDAPPVVREMSEAARRAGVGPMAARGPFGVDAARPGGHPNAFTTSLGTSFPVAVL